MPQGLYAAIAPVPEARAGVRAELDLPAAARIVLGLGYADLRKGADLFFETARAAAAADQGLVFVWVGRLEATVATWIVERDAGGVPPANVRLVPFVQDVGRYLQAADAFYLTSREDPFPSTVLEALSCGLPVVGFAGRSGTEALIRRFGTLVPAYDTAAAVQALVGAIAAQTEARCAGRKAAIAQEHRFEDYAFRLLQALNPAWRRISAVVPNYNYGRYLEERLDSIFRQSVPVYEVIVLDDASADDSLAVVERIARERGRTVRIIANASNSGAIMRQWRRGAQEASGELVWIAEADDLAEPTFLERMSAELGPRTLMAFSDSRQIDTDGQLLAPSYDYYFHRFHGPAFAASFSADGTAFATRFLSVSNIILNVSSVLFRRAALLDALDAALGELETYRFAGDWLTYLTLCRRPGEIAYCAEPLNLHRRHGGSATHATALDAHLAEVARVHAAFAALFGSTAPLAARQEAYRAELSEQFGLDAAEAAE
jgi:hypothetical protein